VSVHRAFGFTKAERDGGLSAVRYATSSGGAAESGPTVSATQTAPVSLSRDRGKTTARQVWETIVVMMAIGGAMAIMASWGTTACR
jgi:hypothetical protein